MLYRQQLLCPDTASSISSVGYLLQAENLQGPRDSQREREREKQALLHMYDAFRIPVPSGARPIDARAEANPLQVRPQSSTLRVLDPLSQPLSSFTRIHKGETRLAC